MAADIIRCIFGISQNPQLSQIPLTAPEGICIVHIMYGLSVFQLQLSYAAIMTGIGTIHIAAKAAPQNSMIKACIEFLTIVYLCSSDVYAAQHLLPCLFVQFPSLIEGHVLGLRLAVQTGILDRCIGDSHCYGHLLALLGGEGNIDTGTWACGFLLALTNILTVESTYTGNLLVQYGREVNGHFSTGLVLLDVLGQGNHITLYGLTIFAYLYVSILHSPALT